MKFASAFLALVIAVPGLASTAEAAVPVSIAKAVQDSTRPKEQRDLDAVRKPSEVLSFAGIKPGQIVAEYLPGGGYYTRMLSDIVGPKGKVFALETTRWGKDNIAATQAVLKEPGRGNVTLDLAPLGNFNLPEKVDVFWTSLNYHDLHVAKYANVDMGAFNRHVFDSLKPGGIYFIIDHQAKAGTGSNDSATLHRIEKDAVVREVSAAGFKLAGTSDLLRNASDDHSKPVFDLHFKTDQFILKFRRP
ncbi:MAG: class I SAM-dependent methyltransferase [Alphaproteobacteria bacterium]|nr:class I SAM-dependent methyltransferase [Alphaproteobacteria bacterium]